jgi:hypothetical protein
LIIIIANSERGTASTKQHKGFSAIDFSAFSDDIDKKGGDIT